MIIIQDVLISEDIIKEYFHCNLDACKGACCVEGDYGAPVSEGEIEKINRILPQVKAFLDEDAMEIINADGAFEYNKDAESNVTKCLSSGACVFLQKSDSGIGKCGLELAWKAGVTDFQKPVSCHLYPIRVSHNELSGFEIWNYDRWHICNPACTLGKEKKIAIYQFLKEAIIRYKGEAFYEELEAAANRDNL